SAGRCGRAVGPSRQTPLLCRPDHPANGQDARRLPSQSRLSLVVRPCLAAPRNRRRIALASFGKSLHHFLARPVCFVALISRGVLCVKETFSSKRCKKPTRPNAPPTSMPPVPAMTVFGSAY